MLMLRTKLLSTAATAVLMSGCSTLSVDYLKMEVEHISHPMAGPPFGPQSEEDTLDQLNLCAGQEASNRRWFLEGCLGYLYRDAGFYGPRLTASFSAGRKWRIEK